MNLTLREPRVVPVRDGDDGYLVGDCNWEGREVTAFAFPLINMTHERLKRLATESVVVECKQPMFAEGIGLLLLRCCFPSCT